MEFLQELSPIVQTLLGTGFTWGMTALVAAIVFTRRELSPKLLDWMLGFAAGVMIAASYWSLLALAFAAGAMIFVVVEDIIPESHRRGHTDLATMGAMIGFAAMMTLDVAFG